MRFYSTHLKAPIVGFKDAVLNGLAPDGGLYVPEQIKRIDNELLKVLPHLNLPEIASELFYHLLAPEFTKQELAHIAQKAFNFPVPLRALSETLNILELFHGETLAFKDFGARFLAEIIQKILPQITKEVLILVATSGDTGSAVANAFYQKEGIKVVLLFPKGKVSELQEAQLTSLGENITPIQIEGTFDDCQAMVKRAFTDRDLRESFFLSSANSINIARLLPQTVYYFAAVGEIMKRATWQSQPIAFTVPSGNFGNLTAGLIARKLGLPIERFISASNDNRIVPAFFETEIFSPKPTIQTLSNAMDVGNPSNFDRIISLEEKKGFALLNVWERKQVLIKLKEYLSAFSVTERDTKNAMKILFEKYQYIACPHTAVGFSAYLREMLNNNLDSNQVILSTAHPAKFKATVEEVLGINIELPNRLKEAIEKRKPPIQLQNEFEELKRFLLDKST
ncbi:MAG: threonine synthase [Chloroherpetonaceae bacterium]|nr:threonine synthase [Chloroherpetonaceae bacterium]